MKFKINSTRLSFSLTLTHLRLAHAATKKKIGKKILPRPKKNEKLNLTQNKPKRVKGKQATTTTKPSFVQFDRSIDRLN